MVKWYDIWGPDDRPEYKFGGRKARYLGSLILRDERVLDTDPAFSHMLGWNETAVLIWLKVKGYEAQDYESDWETIDGPFEAIGIPRFPSI